MIPYNKTRIQDLMNEVQVRLRNFVNPYNFDQEYLLTQIINAIRFSGFQFLPYKVWAFVDKIYVSHRTALPLTFIAPIRLTLVEPKVEARYVDFREYFQLTCWRHKHSWNRPSPNNPIYTITGENYQKVIYIAPNRDYQTGNPPPGFEYYNGPDLIGVLEFHAIPDYNALTETSFFPLPEEFKEGVILEACIRILSKVADTHLLLNLHKNLIDFKSHLWNSYVQKLGTEYREMDEFVEQIPPFVSPPQSLQEELPNKLI